MSPKPLLPGRMRRLAYRVLSKMIPSDRCTILENPAWFEPIDECAARIVAPEYFNTIVGDMVQRSFNLELIDGNLVVYNDGGEVIYEEYVDERYDYGSRGQIRLKALHHRPTKHP